MAETLKDRVSSLMGHNKREKDGYFYTVPSPDSYPYQWFWDSCFHSLIYLRLGQIDCAKKELESLLVRQFKNGMIPHMIYWEKQSSTDFPVIQWGKNDTSTITQPPMLAYAVWEIYKKDHDKGFLRKMYKPMERLYGYFIEERDIRKNQLVSIINPDESGEDNSPRFDIPLGLPPKHTMKANFEKRVALIAKNVSCDFEAKTCMHNFFWVKDVPMNTILVENLRIFSEIAKELGQKEDALFYDEKRKTIKNAMRKYMFEDGAFWTVYDLDYKKIKVMTWAIFAPMFAKLYTKKEVDTLLKRYFLNSHEFQSDYLVPTVSLSDPTYTKNGFWRGPVWMSTNWFIYKGLVNYGKKKEAKIILDSSLSLLNKSGFREQFDPESGEGFGAKNFTWGGLVLDMV